MKTIVVFYSFEGNTRLIAETIADEINADLMEIKPEKEMASKGFMKFMWGGSQVVMGKRPKLKPLSKDLQGYDLLVVGTPVWAWSPAPPIRTFLEDHLPPNKRVAFFSSCEGGGGKTFQKMKEMAGDRDIIAEIESFAPLKQEKEETLDKVRKWARDLR